jgi:GDPmannose 4,6-dehydratase
MITHEGRLEVLEVYNLAAQSHVKISFDIPEYTADVDCGGVIKILEVIRSMKREWREKIRFYQAGTSELYGAVLETPQKETTPFNPVSPYAAAKACAYYMVKCYRSGYNLYAVNGILFNHESPRRGLNFLTMKVVNGIRDICSGKREYIELGNLDSKRDWGHAKDYVKGMWLMLQKDTPDDYVLATGETYSVREFVERSFTKKGMTIEWRNTGNTPEDEVGVDQNGVVRIKINPEFYRPCEVDLLLGDASKARAQLGWEREFKTLDSLIDDMFDTEYSLVS